MDVQATLLYRSLRPINFEATVEAINTLVGVPEMRLEMTTNNTDGCILFTNSEFHVTVTVRPEKFPSTHLESALEAPITQIKEYDFADAIAVHRLHIDVSVGDGPVQVNDQIREWMGRMGTQSSAKPYAIERKLVMLNAFVQHIIDHDTPEAVYWAQSDMIFSPQEVMEARDMPFPLPLVVRPTPLFDENHNNRVGVRLEHSQLFVGRTMLTEPSTLPFGEVVGITMWLMSEKIKNRLTLEHGAMLETPGFPTLYLRHEASDQTDINGRIVVTQSAPQIEAEIPEFNFAAAQWQAPRPSQQGQAQISANTYAAPTEVAPQPQPQAQPAPTPMVAQTPHAPMGFVSDRVSQAPTYAAQPASNAQAAPEVQPAPIAEPAPVVQVVPEQQPQQVEPQPVEAAAPASQTALGWQNGAASQIKSGSQNSIASAVNVAASTAKRTETVVSSSLNSAVASQKASLQANLESHHKVDVGAALVANAKEAEATKKTGLANVLPMRAIGSIAAICLVLAAGLTLAPKFLGDNFDVASLGGNQNSGITVLTGPRLPGQN